MRHKFLFTLAAAVPLLLQAGSTVLAQTGGGDFTTMRLLLQDGFEIKAAAPNGAQYVVFMQKDNSAYACEFVTVTNSRCRAIYRENE